MKEDINPPKVEGVAVAIVCKENELGEAEWSTYLLNLKDQELKGVLVRSNGYGERDKERVTTSELRHMFDTVEPHKAVLVEPLMPEMTTLTNQYWVSFWCEGVLYDKKFIFVRGSLEERNFVQLPLLDGPRGVIIR